MGTTWQCNSCSGTPLCADCGELAATRLRELPALYEACGGALRRRGPRFAERVSGRWPTGISMSEAALGVRQDISQVLAAWCTLVAGERRVPGPAADGVAALAAYLTGQLEWLAAHPAAASFAARLKELTAAAHEVLDPWSPMELGACTEPGCGRPVRAVGSPVPQVGCEGGHRWQPHQWLLLGRRLRSEALAAAS